VAVERGVAVIVVNDVIVSVRITGSGVIVSVEMIRVAVAVTATLRVD
jgi:hypothetical protein